MTLTTSIYLLDPIDDPMALFMEGRRLLNAPGSAVIHDETSDWKADTRTIQHDMGIGLESWLSLDVNTSGKPYTADPDDADDTTPTHYARIMLDTTYGAVNRWGGASGCHAYLIGEFGKWLDVRGIRWAWLNEFTGDISLGRSGLDRFAAK